MCTAELYRGPVLPQPFINSSRKRQHVWLTGAEESPWKRQRAPCFSKGIIGFCILSRTHPADVCSEWPCRRVQPSQESLWGDRTYAQQVQPSKSNHPDASSIVCKLYALIVALCTVCVEGGHVCGHRPWIPCGPLASMYWSKLVHCGFMFVDENQWMRNTPGKCDVLITWFIFMWVRGTKHTSHYVHEN